MSELLLKLAGLDKVTSSTATPRVEMTNTDIENCKAAIKRDNRGYNVQPNRFDMSKPYRVAINYSNEWHNFGDFASADVAAAVGTIVSAAFFGENAKQGEFDDKVVEESEVFQAWLVDPRNADVMLRANDPETCYHKSGTEPVKGAVGSKANPF